MTRHRSLLILAAILIAAVIGAGRLVAMALLTLLLPVYALLLASIFLIVFVVLASVIVPIGHRLLDRRQAISTPKSEITDIEEPRKAA